MSCDSNFDGELSVRSRISESRCMPKNFDRNFGRVRGLRREVIRFVSFSFFSFLLKLSAH